LQHYSLHDIEFFFVQNGNISHSDAMTGALNDELSNDPRFFLELGGRSIIKQIGALSVLDFQRQRGIRRDGDLKLNGLVLLVERSANSVVISAPLGTIQSVVDHGSGLQVKDSSDICSVDRASRQICRNVAKAIRFEYVAGLTVGPFLVQSVSDLARLYCQKVKAGASIQSGSPASAITSRSALGNSKVNTQEQMTWLWTNIISETVKRLAGLNGCSSLDKPAFNQFCSIFVEDLSRNAMMLAIRDIFSEVGWRQVDVDAPMVDRFFVDFQRYQRPFAETLQTMYSLNK
jgi:hypothetical protein